MLARTLNDLLAAALAVLLACHFALPEAWAQQTFTVVRFVTAREGGPVPVGETNLFEATDTKAVAWAQVIVSGQAHAVVFRWIDPRGRLHRVSPTRLVPPGDDVIWDELPIRGQPAAELPGVWSVELYANDRPAAAARFTILPRRVPPAFTLVHQTTVATRSQQTQTGSGTYTHSVINSTDHLTQFTLRLRPDANLIASASGGLLWGTSSGTRGSLAISYNSGPHFFAQAGFQISSVTDHLESPARRTDAQATFFDLRLSPPHGPTLSLSYRRDEAVDDRFPRLTDGTTTTWTLSSSYFVRPLFFSATYTVQDVDDRTSTNFDFSFRSLTLTAVYFPGPALFVIASHTRLAQDFGATAFSPAFGQQSNTTSVRLTYRPTPQLALTPFVSSNDLARTDGLLSMSTTQFGVEAAYRVTRWLQLTAMTQWQTQASIFAGFAGSTEQRLNRFGVDLFLAGNLTLGAAFSPQITVKGSAGTYADVWTAYVNFFPDPKFFLTGTYTVTRTQGSGTDTLHAAWSLSARYAPTPWVEYQLSAQVADTRSKLFPAASVYQLGYHFTAIFRF
ncbi:MAG: hypothetical protein QN163_01690 [Armatimonadota bacterium]|nr:hypothetical protein [Armatimonadota bacterium]